MVLNRLIVTGHGRKVYDERFHNGINILRGKNGSGKTTISEMIFYVLGGESVDWTTEAISCEYVFAEFVFSGETLSLKREISNDPKPISVAEGDLEVNYDNNSRWSVYGRRRDERRESFSQFLFQKLGFPPTTSDDSNANVTMYQVMRLLYGDQNTESSSIFRKEKNQFADRHDIRKSVGEMLLGIDDFRSHELRQELIRVTKVYTQKKSRLDGLTEAAMKTDPNFSLNQYSDMIQNTLNEQQGLEANLKSIQSSKKESEEIPSGNSKIINSLQDNLILQNEKISEISATIQSLTLNIADSEIFVMSLESDLAALSSANETKEIIGHVNLLYCPICLENLGEVEGEHCPLCKTSSNGGISGGGRIRFSQELKHQIGESKKLLDERRKHLLDAERDYKQQIRVRDVTLSELRSLVAPSVLVDPVVSGLLKKHGYLSRLIEDLARLEGVQTEILNLEKDVAILRSQVESVERELKSRQERQEERQSWCQEWISKFTIDILHQDIVDQNSDTLRNAKGLIFSFDKDFLSVRSGRLSASTQAFLKNSFYLGLLKFSIEDEKCRIPRFFILDNIEDKGMVPERFRNFHDLLVEYSETVHGPHQVILTTSYIDKSLNGSEYCVGPSYDAPPYTLDLNGEWEHFRDDNVKES